MPVMIRAMPVMIHDLEYRAYWVRGVGYFLPGTPIDHSTDDPMARMAIQNTQRVADFMSSILDRNGHHIGTIKCSKDGTNRELRGAWWIPDYRQAVYGQYRPDPERRPNQYKSFAEDLGIVAHEMFHGVTFDEATKLNREGQSGSLHESYSDIFAIIILNHGNTNISEWNWELGRPFGRHGDPIRNFANPQLYRQPDHWSEYDPDHEHPLHHNCGIHNKAAYNLMNATYDHAPNKYLFDSVTLSRLFYHTLNKLGYGSIFRDSGVQLRSTAASFFKKNGSLQRRAETAINKAFADVGIRL